MGEAPDFICYERWPGPDEDDEFLTEGWENRSIADVVFDYLKNDVPNVHKWTWSDPEANTSPSPVKFTVSSKMMLEMEQEGHKTMFDALMSKYSLGNYSRIEQYYNPKNMSYVVTFS